MPRRLLDAARVATQHAAWSDLEDKISDDENTVESEDSVDDIDQPSPEARGDVTHESMEDPSSVTAKMH